LIIDFDSTWNSSRRCCLGLPLGLADDPQVRILVNQRVSQTEPNRILSPELAILAYLTQSLALRSRLVLVSPRPPANCPWEYLVGQARCPRSGPLGRFRVALVTIKQMEAPISVHNHWLVQQHLSFLFLCYLSKNEQIFFPVRYGALSSLFSWSQIGKQHFGGRISNLLYLYAKCSR
jgi:hypothetical protein